MVRLSQFARVFNAFLFFPSWWLHGFVWHCVSIRVVLFCLSPRPVPVVTSAATPRQLRLRAAPPWWGCCVQRVCFLSCMAVLCATRDHIVGRVSAVWRCFCQRVAAGSSRLRYSLAVGYLHHSVMVHVCLYLYMYVKVYECRWTYTCSICETFVVCTHSTTCFVYGSICLYVVV